MRDAVTTDLSGVAVLTEPMPAATSVGLDADADAAPPTPGGAKAAKRALAAAARERRRYERQEVRRFTKRSRRRRITWMVVVGSLVALVAVVGIGAYSPLMALRDVRIEGAQRIPAADVQAAFDGVLGTPLPLIDSAEVHAALAAFPLIETYSTETHPAGHPGGADRRAHAGRRRSTTGVGPRAGGCRGRGDRPPRRGARGPADDRGRRRHRRRGLPRGRRGRAEPAGGRARASSSRATAATADDVRLELAGGASVVWGSAEDSALKATVLATLMRAAPPDTVSQYDVSAPSSPVTE